LEGHKDYTHGFSLNNELGIRDYNLLVDFINEFLTLVKERYGTDIEKLSKEKQGVLVDDNVIIDIIDRVHLKKFYYTVFHKIHISKVAENKTIGIFIYWILKLRPIKSGIRIVGYDLNEMFAQYLFGKALMLYEGDDFAYDGDYMKSYFEEVLYSFKYRDLSKESIILMLEYSFHKYRKRKN
jgi:hypothetical protein